MISEVDSSQSGIHVARRHRHMQTVHRYLKMESEFLICDKGSKYRVVWLWCRATKVPNLRNQLPSLGPALLLDEWPAAPQIVVHYAAELVEVEIHVVFLHLQGVIHRLTCRVFAHDIFLLVLDLGEARGVFLEQFEARPAHVPITGLHSLHRDTVAIYRVRALLEVGV